MTSPTVIDKKYLTDIVFIAAGRFHSIAIRKQNEQDKNKKYNDDISSDD